MLWPFYNSLPPATFPHKAARLSWLRTRIATTAQALEMVQPVAPGCLRPCNADGSYDDYDDDEGSLRYVLDRTVRVGGEVGRGGSVVSCHIV